MANIKSSEKANRQRIRRTKVNHARKTTMRTAIKKVRAALVSGNSGEAKASLASAVKLIDRAGGRGVVKANTRSRLVSRLTKAVAKL